MILRCIRDTCSIFYLAIYKYMAMILYPCTVEKIWVIWTLTYTQWQKKRLRGWRGKKISIVSPFYFPLNENYSIASYSLINFVDIPKISLSLYQGNLELVKQLVQSMP